MAQKFYNESDIQAIASAIRSKNGLSSTYTVSQMASAIQDIPSGSGGGGNTDIEDRLVTRALSRYENSRVTSIGAYAFASCSVLTSVSFPQVTTINSQAFYGCSSLTSVSFPQVTTINSQAFYGCFRLTSVSFPQAKYINNYAFYGCSSLTSVSFPQVSIIGESAFRGCSSLTSAIFPQAQYIYYMAFCNCFHLTSVSLPQVIEVDEYAFASCSILASVRLGGEQSKSGTIFRACFSQCYNLINLTLYDGQDDGSYLYSLSNSTAFRSTPIAGYSTSAGQYGSIYVPASLYSQYISATNWAYFSSRIVSF